MDNKKDFLLDEDEDFLPLSPSEPEEEVKEEPIPLENILNTNQEVKEEPVENNVDIKPDETYAQVNQMPGAININSIFNDNNEEELPQEEVKTNKFVLYNKFKILPVIAFAFVSILGIYIFVNNVKADIINLIKIEENQKIGYINNSGNVVIRPKFLYGTDFYKGYAIVKNYNNLFGIIDGKGNNEISFGNIFSANLYSDRYIVAKFTNDGLKMGLLDSNLKEVTRYIYDNLSYSKAGVFMYTANDTMGILNADGKEIYSYKVDEVDDRNISIEVSNLTNKSSSDTYAKIKVNSSSTIINTKTGKEVYKYTLDDIRVLDNNVFYIKNEDGNNKYFVIKDDKIVYETSEYKRLRIEDLDSDIAIAIKDDATIDYINLLNKQRINEDGNIKYTYSDGVVLREMYNFANNKTEYTVITPKKVLSTFSSVKPVDDTFVNGNMKILTDNNKYNFVNKNGTVISSKEYETATDFNKNGFAIVTNDNMYGVIDASGKEVLTLKYDEIKFLDDTLFKNIYKQTNEQLFIFRESNKYGIINSNGKVVVKPIYDDFKTITTKYPIIKAKYNNENTLVNLQNYKDLTVKSNDIQVYEDYIIADDDYYNYNGELIYTIGG